MWKLIFDYIITPLVIFIGGYIYLRIAGKKAVSQMSSFDLLFVIIMGTIVSEPIVDKNLLRTLVYALSLLILFIMFSHATLNNKLRWLLIASPTVLIRNGDIDEDGLKKSKLTVSQLLGELRQKGYTKTSDVELAVMEDSGQFSFIPKSTARPLQPSDICLTPSPTFIPIPIILDGQILDHNLKYLNKDREWLEMQLQAYSLSLKELDKVTLATYNQKGHLDVDTTSKHENKSPYAYKPGNKN